MTKYKVLYLVLMRIHANTLLGLYAMPTSENTKKIIHELNSKNESMIATFEISELQEAIIDLGSLNKSDRIAIQFEIDKRENNNERKYQSYIRALSYIAVLAIGILAGYFGSKL